MPSKDRLDKFDPANPLRCERPENIAGGQFAICCNLATSKRFHEQGASTASVLFPMFRYFEWLGYNWEPDPNILRTQSFAESVNEFMNNIYEAGNALDCCEERDL